MKIIAGMNVSDPFIPEIRVIKELIMAEQNKTQKTGESVEEFLKAIPEEKKRQDSSTILELMKEVTGEAPEMWGTSIVGFGDQHYRYASGREGDWFYTGFSPRKQNLTLYLTGGFDQYDELLKRLGKYKTGKGCLYINKIEDVDLPTLRELVRQSVEQARKS